MILLLYPPPLTCASEELLKVFAKILDSVLIGGVGRSSDSSPRKNGGLDLSVL
jgi:hypothetical protein